MQTFADQLTQVRKEHHITQNELATAMSVARQTISHWENGRSMPDIDTIRQLSQVLDHDFLAMEVKGAENPVPEAAPAPGTQAADSMNESAAAAEDKPSAKKPNGRVHLMAVLGVLLIAVLLIVFLPKGQSGQMAQVEIVPMENPVLAIRSEDFPDGVGWFWGFRIAETAGVPFTISELTVICISDDGKEYPTVYTGEQCADFFGSDTLEQNLPQTWMGGFPVQRTSTVRLTISGKDANGNKLTFESSLELSKEVAE